VFGLVEEFPAEEQPLLTAQSIVSLLVLPIFSDGELWGFVGFDDCSRRKVWTRAELDLLLSLSIGISARLSESRDAPENLERHAATYMAVIRSLLELGKVAGADKPLSDALLQTRARIRVVVAIHRFLLRQDDSEAVDAPIFAEFCQGELRRSLDDCGHPELRVRAMAAPFPIPRRFTIDLGVLLHEAMLAFACRHNSSPGQGGLSLGMHEERGTAVIRLRFEGTDDAARYEVPDALGLVLVRRIAQQLSGQVEVPGRDAAARIVIPLRNREAAE
jgi:two-component sensor histidine kinase